MERILKSEVKAVVLIFLTYVLREVWEVWTIFDPSTSVDDKINPFPLSSQDIYPETYIWFYWLYAAFIVYNFIILSLLTDEKVKFFFKIAVLLAGLEFLEFPINYNEYWFGKNTLINVTTIRFVVLFYIGSKILRYPWKSTRMPLSL